MCGILSRSGRMRRHLVATHTQGHAVTLITIYGTGEAYFTDSQSISRIMSPTSDLASKQLQSSILVSAGLRGLASIAAVKAHLGGKK